MDIVLTPSQEAGKNKILNFLSSEHREMRIVGKAGSGKTTMIKYALKEYFEKNPDDSVVGITVSHKAKNILSKSVDYVATFAKAYGYKEKILKNGNRVFEPDPYMINKAICKSTNKAFIIDECSMFSQEMLNIVRNETDMFTKIIYLGDRNQLPPIITDNNKDDNTDSPVFYIDLSDELSHELTEVVRQEKDNPIISVASIVADEIQGSCNLNRIRELLFRNHLKDDKGIRTISAMEFPFHYFEHAKDNLLLNKVITYKNDVTNAHNNTLRNLIYNNPESIVIKDEVIFFNDTYFEEDTSVVIQNSSEFIIQDIFKRKVDDVECYIITVDDAGIKKQFPVPTEKGHIYYKQTCELYYENKKFERYWAFKNQFANISSSFSITAYKCQGSTYDNVYIDLNDLLSWKIPISDKRRLQAIYTAITRARYNVYIIE